mmetsp:Transcript_13079/g.20409  ORF Transcript_13079/g.20409 Transcript_13079/m.20409 type:complete len:335 (-) Transcript_13079:11-1015(-)
MNRALYLTLCISSLRSSLHFPGYSARASFIDSRVIQSQCFLYPSLQTMSSQKKRKSQTSLTNFFTAPVSGKKKSKIRGSHDEQGAEEKREEETKQEVVGGEMVDVHGMPLDGRWHGVLSTEFSKPYFETLVGFIHGRRTSGKIIYPPQNMVFSALNECPLDSIKVVIIGQDPYHGPNQAHGMSFSVLPGVPHPPSLRNMIKEAVEDVSIQPPAKNYGYLINWSRQGVLLLNAVLTVEKASANSHQKKGWEQFTDAVIREVSRQSPGCVFLLWGKPAQAKARGIDRGKHRVIESAHPSPLSATKTNAPFIGSRCYSRANALLAELGREPVDWSIS